jgi:hypothetical protein
MAGTSDMTPSGALEFVETAARQRAEHYRQQVARFRSMAEVEPLASLRRHLTALARQYDELADAAGVPNGA